VSAAAERMADGLAPPKLLIMDLDGTLVDTVPDLTACIDAMLANLGRPHCGEARVRDWVGNGVDRLVKRALTGSQDGEPEAALFDRGLHLFMTHYAENTSGRSHPYPGAVKTLEYFRNTGVPMVCITNKASIFTQKLLADLGLRGWFELVLSGDTLARKKPDPLQLLHAAAHFGFSPRQCLMVGDSKTDVAAARAAGTPVVCVSYGYNHGEDIRAAGPDAVIDSLEELPALLESAASNNR